MGKLGFSIDGEMEDNYLLILTFLHVLTKCPQREMREIYKGKIIRKENTIHNTILYKYRILLLNLDLGYLLRAVINMATNEFLNGFHVQCGTLCIVYLT